MSKETTLSCYVNEINNRIVFKIKSGDKLELLSKETTLSIRKILMNTAIKTGTNFNSKYGKKLTDTAIKTGKDFATIAGKKIVHKSAEATGDLTKK